DLAPAIGGDRDCRTAAADRRRQCLAAVDRGEAEPAPAADLGCGARLRIAAHIARKRPALRGAGRIRAGGECHWMERAGYVLLAPGVTAARLRSHLWRAAGLYRRRWHDPVYGDARREISTSAVCRYRGARTPFECPWPQRILAYPYGQAHLGR